MNKLLLASVAALALSGCNSNASSLPTCSGANTIAALQPILQNNVIDVFNLAFPNDPYTLDMKASHIITVNETPHKVDCKILLNISNKANPPSSLQVSGEGDNNVSDADWITYTVEITDNDDAIFVHAHWSAALNADLDTVKTTLLLKKYEAEAAAQKAAADAKEKAAHTIDTTASCNGLTAGINRQTAISNSPQLSLVATDVSTMSPGVCLVYMARSRRQIVGLPPYQSVYVYSFTPVTYNMTLDGPKIVKEDQWLPNPLDGQSVPEGMQHDSNTGYFSGENLLVTVTKTPSAELSPLEKVRHGLRDDGTPASTAGGDNGTPGEPHPPIRPKPRIQTNDPAGMY